MALYGSKNIIILKVNIKNISPFHIGSDNDGILIDEETNEVWIPGTTLAGAFRSYLNKNMDKEFVDEMFGQGSNISKIFFYDSFTKLTKMENRSGVGIDSQLGSAGNKKLFERVFVGNAGEFQLEIEIYVPNKNKLEQYKNAIYSCIAAIHNGDINLGSYKNIGSGNFKVNKVEEAIVDLENPVNLFEYLRNKIKFNKGSLEEINKIAMDSNEVTFELLGSLKTPLLIKAKEKMDSDLPDGESIQNVYDEYIIPGSSLKGVIRAQGERILNYYNMDFMMEDIFGNMANDNSIKKQSKIKTFDCEITESCQSIYNRIKLDKFTSAVRNGAKMDDKPIMGDVILKSKLQIEKKDDTYNSVAIAVLSMIFRDISIGNLSLGSGYNIGRGRILGNKLVIKKGKEKIYEYDFKDKALKVDKLEPYFKKFNTLKKEEH